MSILGSPSIIFEGLLVIIFRWAASTFRGDWCVDLVNGRRALHLCAVTVREEIKFIRENPRFRVINFIL